MSIGALIGAFISFVQIWLLWRISRSVEVAASDAERKKELNDNIKKFGMMFAEAAEVPKPPKKKFLEPQTE